MTVINALATRRPPGRGATKVGGSACGLLMLQAFCDESGKDGLFVLAGDHDFVQDWDAWEGAEREPLPGTGRGRCRGHRHACLKSICAADSQSQQPKGRQASARMLRALALTRLDVPDPRLAIQSEAKTQSQYQSSPR